MEGAKAKIEHGDGHNAAIILEQEDAAQRSLGSRSFVGSGSGGGLCCLGRGFCVNRLDQPFHALVEAYLCHGGTRLDVPSAVRDTTEFQTFHDFVSAEGQLHVLLVGKYEKGHSP